MAFERRFNAIRFYSKLNHFVLSPRKKAEPFRFKNSSEWFCGLYLFNARISPKRKISTLSEEDIDRLFNTVKSTLEEMTRRGGRDTEKDLYGALGNYRTILSKNTYHAPCPICGERIQKEAYLGGRIYYCPHCQRER